MKKERDIYPKFQAAIKKQYPDSFYYKIPDTANLGGRKPFDFVCVIYGIPFAIEFKRDEKTKATLYQKYQLDKFQKAGGIAFVSESWRGAMLIIEQIFMLRNTPRKEV